jgi:alkanesulfonate monooxygenase SsuD/methylene tetrahydromethanopterin reductase-like flavin-dependent oxidoreductase (luciferase family)
VLSGGARCNSPSLGIPFDHKVDRFEEALQIIVPLLREGRVRFHGAHYRAVDCEIVPRGPRSQGPPVLIAASGPRMLRLTARYADCWNTAWLGPAGTLGERRFALEAACAAEGRDPATLAVTVGVSVDYSGPARSAQTPASSPQALSGSPEEIASGLRGYAEAGVAHVICALTPQCDVSGTPGGGAGRLSPNGHLGSCSTRTALSR